MMKPDLYAVLGVKTNATPDAIRRSYRKLARKYHPDHNPGNPTVADKYHAVTHAYTILANPETRQRYDETGNDDIPRDMGLSELAGVLIPAFMSIVAESINSQFGGDLKTTDMVSRIITNIRDRRAAVTDQLNTMKRHREKLRVLSGRFTVDGGENLFESAINAELTKIDRPIADGTAEVERIGRALTYMTTVKYRTDPRPGGKTTSVGDLGQLLGVTNPRMFFTGGA